MAASDHPALDPVPHPLDHLAERGPRNAPALVLKERTLTHGDLAARVALLAGWLASRWNAGDRIASWAAKGELTCLLPLAAARAGMVHVPINPLLKRAQVAHILSDSGASVLIATAARLKSLEDPDTPAGCAPMSEEDAWQEAERVDAMLPLSERDPEKLAAILYTSGSTGKPKGVMLSHANMWLGAVSVAHYLGLAADDVTLAVLPLSFDYGQSQLLSTWYAGGSVVPLDYLFPRDVAKACARHAVTTLAAVSPLWVQLGEVKWPEEAVTSLRRVTNSGGALTVEIISDLRDKLPNKKIFPMYGLTEAFRSTYLDPDLVAEHPTSMGRAIPFAEILVIDEAGNVCEAGEEGELVHCGPLVAQGYWNDPARTLERFRPAPAASTYGGTAVWSGDRVKRDEKGLLYFVGRRDAMIKSSGNRISPQEIESAALATGLVAEAVALGVPDTRLGHAIHLVVRGDEGARADLLARQIAKELPNFMQPQVIHWREAMPLNPNGKIDRTALAAEIGA
ncbi:acyl-CoA ligase (AMP-forming), exosortase A system-associated [Erythrobacter sp. SD-21]|uniref:acyl-CoA ligase (AMP-forming), exosortase A system-associated n=1 Tax=Erythrobacter sp. SD-21 TaxID=161528 RepID=UPI000153F058|nr:acyl-CoA ligase (AMP-forming), exosortase A system-associated [Erythrobacter sp. SD-21]EDL50420.1 AMP-binding enzyme domain protein [Erythrobacter sp. SD-21]